MLTALRCTSACAVIGAASAANFIFILADDMGWGDPGYNGGNALTPNLDAIAKSKHTIRFDRFYAENVCSPSRTSIMTGRVPDRMCIWSANTNGLNATNEFTLGLAASAAGARTAHFGKWHIGAFSESIKNKHMSPQGQKVAGPLQFGYQHMYSSQPPAWAHINTNCGCCANLTVGCQATPNRPASAPKITAATKCVDPNQLLVGNALKAYNSECDTYYFNSATSPETIVGVTDLLAQDDSKTIGDAVVQWLKAIAEAGDEKPFMATVWFHTPHENFGATEKWMRLYDGTSYTDEQKAFYADISGMDFQIGRIRSALEDLGLAHDTAIFFTADNGPERGTPGSTAGLRGRKRDLLEGGIRNPGLMEWPKRVTANRRTDFPAKIVDYLPTLIDALGPDAASPHPEWPLDGLSLLPFIDEIVRQPAGSPAPVRPKALGWVTQHALGGKVPLKRTHESMQMAWMDGDLKLYATRNGPTDFQYYLFNITADAAEQDDLSAAMPEVVSKMDEELQLWIASVAKSRTEAENNCNRWDPQGETPRTNMV